MIAIKRLSAQTYELTDADKDSFYLVIGSRKAAVIDTGISKGERILPQLKALTTLPMVLVLTHAHIDHFHHMDEFETVYMSHKELSMPRGLPPERSFYNASARQSAEFRAVMRYDRSGRAGSQWLCCRKTLPWPGSDSGAVAACGLWPRGSGVQAGHCRLKAVVLDAIFQNLKAYFFVGMVGNGVGLVNEKAKVLVAGGQA